jgi:hypothetical protein
MMTAPNPLLPVADSSGELDKRQGGCEGGGRGLIPGLLARTRGEVEEHSAASSCPNRGRNGGPVHDSRVEDREKGENPTAWAQPVEEGGVRAAGRGAETGGVGQATAVQHRMEAAERGSARGGRKNGPSPRAQCQFPFIPNFSIDSKLKWFKEGLLELKNSQIKYEFEGFE